MPLFAHIGYMRNNKGILYLATIFLTFLIVFSSFFYNQTTSAQEIKYYLGGNLAGFVLDENGATILTITDVLSESGQRSPSNEAGLKEGDLITSINGNKITTCTDIDKILSSYQQGELVLELERNNKKIIKSITPVKDVNGKYKLGLIIRDAISGIGTITYTTSEGEFSALGHPIFDNKEIFNSSSGKIYNCSLLGILKGKKGCPGEIRGVFIETDEIGEIQKNTINGIKGIIKENEQKKEIKLGTAEIGKASIYSSITDFGVKEYSISIIKCDYNNKRNKNFVIKVTDKELLETTGGIIQGMSGSPIVQNGKLVGAVTHVFVNDPSKGFGISINNLISNN